MARKAKLVEAIGYMRTSSSTNVGEAKDSDKRQRAAIEGYAKAAGYVIVDWFYDAAVRGSDAVALRPGFATMLERIAGNGVRTIIVESPDRFARDLAVQLAGHDHLKSRGVTLIPATAPDHFIEDTPTAVLVRQVLGAIAQFEKASTVAKLKAARDRKIAAGEKCGGRKSDAERDPELVSLARQLYRPDRIAVRYHCAKFLLRWQRPARSRPAACRIRHRLSHRCWRIRKHRKPRQLPQLVRSRRGFRFRLGGMGTTGLNRCRPYRRPITGGLSASDKVRKLFALFASGSEKAWRCLRAKTSHPRQYLRQCHDRMNVIDVMMLLNAQ